MKNRNKLGLGTVQWGLAYGLSNQGGVTSPAAVTAILDEARYRGISVLDTAFLYGDAETVLGKNKLDAFRVVSKTPKFATPVITDEQARQMKVAFQQSLLRLSSERIYGLLIHHADDLIVPGGEKLVESLDALKQSRVVEKIGVSVYSTEQLEAVLRVFTPDIVQIPISVLDQRFLLSGQLERMKNNGIEIHARSVFLQGLLLMPLAKIPKYFDPIKPLLAKWHSAAEMQRMSQVQAALSFVRDLPCVDTVLVGVESLAQMQSCIADFSLDASFNATHLACNASDFVNPANWKI